MKCRACNSINLEPVIDLGRQPWCNNFLKKEELGKENFYPLRVLFCSDCSTAQLDFTVPKEIMFSDHTYLSGVTKSLSNHFKNIALDLNNIFKDDMKKCVLDIGSNDGTQLKHFKDLGWDVLGVESSKRTSAIANRDGIETVHAFFNEDFANHLNKKFDVINAAGVFFHLEELHSVTAGIKKILKNEGIFVVQFLYIKSIIENIAFDQIYHEHLLYYSLKTLNQLLEMHDLEIFDCYLAHIHGGQMIAHVTHKGRKLKSGRYKSYISSEEVSNLNNIETYKALAKQIEFLKTKNLSFLNQAKDDGKLVYGMGAPVKGNTLLNYFGIGTDLIPVLLERNILRKGLFSPGMHIPILIEDEVDIVPDIYYVLAWNFKKEILERNAHLIEKGVHFYFPIDGKEI